MRRIKPEVMISLSIISVTLLISCVSGDGQLGYGDKCSVQNAILRVFANTDVQQNEKCNSNQGLICTGTCTCPPTRLWDKGPLFGLFGGGSCIVGANGPCSQGDRCVANARCGDNIPLCFCEDGYYAHDLQCISNYGHSLVSSGSSLKLSPISLAILPVTLIHFIMKYF